VYSDLYLHVFYKHFFVQVKIYRHMHMHACIDSMWIYMYLSLFFLFSFPFLSSPISILKRYFALIFQTSLGIVFQFGCVDFINILFFISFYTSLMKILNKTGENTRSPSSALKLPSSPAHHVYCSTIHNSQVMETAKMPQNVIIRW
jgi:hypothetical protein